ncbi:hypothetical protein GCM10023189_22360 [Nibrella saemangeumensis]|uniref:Outer membrane lipoprotein-sorting protein n=1 Tax=Nibrella saemangeumensis TaxID=1084526 RepID=A0ABP8MVI6_9BACT
MKKLVLTVLCLPALCLSVLAQSTPSADEVMDKYLVAIGGKDLLATINTLTVDMSTEMQGNTMIMTRKQVAPNKFSQVGYANGMELFKMVSDGSKVAMVSPRGNQTMEGAQAQQAILMNMLFPEMQLAKMGVKSTVAGSEKVNGKDAYKVTHTTADGAITWSDFYDAASGLKVQTVSMMRTPQGEREQAILYADYKDFKGLKYPTTITQGSGQFQRQSTVDKVKINDKVKDSDFAVAQ